MPLPELPHYNLLLQVFRQGLIKNLILKEEVVSWADEIIVNTDEPDYFFIELSLSHHKNDLIEAINKNWVETENPVCTRVLIGLIYNKFIVDSDVSTDDMMIAINALTSLNIDTLTYFEMNTIYAFEDYEMFYGLDSFQLHTDAFRFFSLYKSFSLNNYNEWETINIKVEAALKVERIRTDLMIKSHYEAEQIAEKQQKKQSNRHLLYKMLALITIVVNSILAIYLTIQFVTDYSKPNAHHEYIAPILTLIWFIWRLKVFYFK